MLQNIKFKLFLTLELPPTILFIPILSRNKTILNGHRNTAFHSQQPIQSINFTKLSNTLQTWKSFGELPSSNNKVTIYQPHFLTSLGMTFKLNKKLQKEYFKSAKWESVWWEFISTVVLDNMGHQPLKEPSQMQENA